MDSEDDLFRPPALRPYQTGNIRLELPAKALAATRSILQSAGQRECGLFWYGPKDEIGNGRVAYVAAPKQFMNPRNYYIATDALTDLVRQVPDGFKPLAQIHSHPGPRVEHSNYDDRMVSTRKALSLVFPSYGRTRGVFPAGIGVHEFQIDYWHLLDAGNVVKRVIVCEGDVKVEDFR